MRLSSHLIRSSAQSRRALRFAAPGVVVLILLSAALLPLPASADCGWTEIRCQIAQSGASIFGAIATMLWGLSDVAARFMTWALVDVNENIGFVNNDFVRIGWAVVRDISNWFFVVFFLISAVATILNFDRYHARRVLPRLLIMAILVNFSLFITGFVVNAANLLMYLFVSNGVGQFGDIGLILSNAMRSVEARFSGDALAGSQFVADDPQARMGLASLQLAFSVGSIAMAGLTTFIFFFLGLLLITRVVYLWVSIILSPLAFVMSSFDKTQTFFQKWSQRFINQSIFGIIAAFFIWLAAYLAVYIASNPLGTSVSSVVLTDSNESKAMSILFQNMDMLFSFATIFVFLYLAMKISKEMSGEAGAMIFGAMKTALLGVGLAGGAGLLAKAGAGAAAGGRRAYRNVGAQSEGGSLADRATRIMLRTPGLKRAGELAESRQRDYRGGRRQRIDDRAYDKMGRRDHTIRAQAGVDAAIMTDANAGAVLTAVRKGIQLTMNDEQFGRIAGKLRETNQADDFLAAHAGRAASLGLLPGQRGQQATTDEQREAATREYFSREGRGRAHLVSASALEDTSVANGLAGAFATNQIDMRNVLRRMDQADNFEGFAAMQQQMQERFVDPNTGQVHVEIELAQPDGTRVTQAVAPGVQSHFSSPTTRALSAGEAERRRLDEDMERYRSEPGRYS